MHRRNFLRHLSISTSLLISAPVFGSPLSRSFSSRSERSRELEEITLKQLEEGLRKRHFTSVALTKMYQQRIALLDKGGPRLNSVIELNPEALELARTLDAEAHQGHFRGPLHGIPILIKDNIATADQMQTTAGSLALMEARPTQDAFLVSKLRQAGAVLLGKTNLSEWANFRSTRSTSGWSGRGGLTKNPYCLDRNPSGSSSGSGVAVAANLCPVAVGTETDGSILAPSSVNGIVGIKPTVGLISRSGIIPIAFSQDTAGPMTRTVTDAAILLSVLAGYDPRDTATAAIKEVRVPDYTEYLDADGLRGARIGIVRKGFTVLPEAWALCERAAGEMKRLGAEIIDPTSISNWGKLDDAEYQVLLYEFKEGLNAYLASLNPPGQVRTLKDLIEFNESHAEQEMPYFKQEVLLQAQEKGPLTESDYQNARSQCIRLARNEGIDALMSTYNLDALVTPTTGPASVTDLLHGDRDVGASTTVAAVAGYPSITVPVGHISGLPVGISFFGKAYSEPKLIRLAFAFEQATQARRTPKFLTKLS